MVTQISMRLLNYHFLSLRGLFNIYFNKTLSQRLFRYTISDDILRPDCLVSHCTDGVTTRIVSCLLTHLRGPHRVEPVDLSIKFLWVMGL